MNIKIKKLIQDKIEGWIEIAYLILLNLWYYFLKFGCNSKNNNHINNHKSVSYNKSQNFSNTTFQAVLIDFVENTLAQLLLLSLFYFVLWFEENLKISMKKNRTFNL